MRPARAVVSATKGLEEDSLLADVGDDRRRSRVRRIRSPSSRGRASPRSRRGLPTAVVVASRSATRRRARAGGVPTPYFRLYGTADVVGVEIGGALKNVIAIAAGVVEGLGLGHNALAGLITRGLAEITRLACARGRAARDAGGPGGPRRSGADVHRVAQPQPARRHRAGARAARWRTISGEHEDGGRRRADDRRRAGARRAARRRAADRRRRWPRCSAGARMRARRSYELMLRPQRAETDTG